jgi:hypothetical protein
VHCGVAPSTECAGQTVRMQHRHIEHLL